MLVLAAQQVAAQTVRGKLLDQYTNQPIPNATITLVKPDNSPVGVTAKSGNDGSFSIRAPGPGVYRLRAELPGYVAAATPAFELAQGDQLNINWRLLAGVVSLRPIAIVGNARATSPRLKGFYDRAQRRGFGYFITREKIDQLRPFRVTDLLRTVPGLQVVPSLRGFGDLVRTTEGCTPAVYLDGSRFPLMGESIDDIVNPMSLEGIEVYPHTAEVPAEFQGPFANCGVIALWTRPA
jgi:hypothetical protein